MDLWPAQDNAIPQTPFPSPHPRAIVTSEATEESCSASQWPDSHWHFTLDLAEGREWEGLEPGKKARQIPKKCRGMPYRYPELARDCKDTASEIFFFFFFGGGIRHH